MARVRLLRRRLERAARLVAAVVLGLCALVLVAVGAVEWHDRNLPRHWGTFTETSTVCDGGPRRGCTVTGTWVSEDGSMVKADIELDGTVEPGRSVRAVYQPGGGRGDDADNIVHTAPWANAGLWVPFVLAVAVAVGAWRVGRRSPQVLPAE
ncbi:hypothetical protein GUY44_06440 [Pimelobacter simplex]|uniref:hypothetical protein n=1 Tax=Nocardioides simplex TaxID=2045 RepID=UPI0008E03C4F|nr:hypothetical protein [Pimelobacter simplex]MCG8150112.1 hypothetical protein [Pimelobacter simplex]GEB13678.1 hypothetical protein NSI01_19930 [Pimelobacter simplex]SFM70111.1 hypothetical protein SAMN05421671_2992 [Pimelobacter simplex]